jgi:hypothetical protein
MERRRASLQAVTPMEDDERSGLLSSIRRLWGG